MIKKKRKGRVRRSHYGCYPTKLTSAQKIKRAMTFALLIALCCSAPAMAATKKKQQSWQAQCQKSEKGLAECCAEKEAACKRKTDEQTCSNQLHACLEVTAISFSSGSVGAVSSSSTSKKTKSSAISNIQARTKLLKAKMKK